jgi:enterobacterial common antigen flippase
MRVSRSMLLSLTASGATVLGLGLVGGILAARLLGPEGRGELAVLLFWPHLLAGVFSLSLNEVVAIRSAADDPVESHTYLSVSLALTLGIAAAVMAGGYYLMPSLLGEARAELTSHARAYLLLFVPVSMVWVCMLGFVQARHKFHALSVLRVLQPALYVCVLLVLALADEATAANFAYATALTIAIVALWTSFVAKSPRLSLDRQMLSDVIRTGVGFHFVSLTIFAASEFDKLILVSNASNADIGFYMVAFSVASASSIIVGQTANSIVPPMLARCREPEERSRVFAGVTAISILAVTMATLVMIVLAPLIVPALFGREFGVAVPVCQVLSVAVAIKAARHMMDRALRACGVVYWSVFAELACLVVLIAAVSPMLERFGLVGVGAVQVAAQFVALLVMMLIARRTLAVSMRHYLREGPVVLRDFVSGSLSAKLRR